ncbi:MAG: hypothetical protein MAGBODY4_00785 [Candidatus Marinimicrobia bacterium]|nr:hypothetical protein [Candidatus Neomarinimicrobiota bacterium]
MPARLADQLETVADEATVSSLYEDYVHLHNYPITWEELDRKTVKQIPALTARERTTLLEVRKKHPHLDEWTVVGKKLPAEAIEILKYTVRLSHEPAVRGHLRWRGKSSRVEDYQSYTRLRFAKSNTINGSVVTERDPGEQSATDHLAGGVEFSNLPGIDKLILGQFRLGYGLGVSFGPAMGLAKSSSAVSNVDQSYMRLRINDSSLESLGFTGAAARTHYGNHHIQAAGAYTSKDGSWNGDEIVISQSGLHLTEGSLQRKDNIIERLGNGAYWYAGDQIDIGMQYSQIRRKRGSDDAWLEKFVFGSAWFETDHLSHETGIDLSGNRAYLTTVRSAIDAVEVAVAHRWYDPQYHAPYASGFGEYSGTSNETGWYAGIQVDTDAVRWSGYIDVFHEITNTKSPPKEGTEWLLRADWRPRPRMQLSGSVKNETKEVSATDAADGVEFEFNILRWKQEYQGQWRYRWDSGFTADVRTEYVTVHYPDRRYTGNQWAYKLTFPIRARDRLQVFLVPYDVESSDASTYYFVMPVTGTMQLLRQTGAGMITGGQIRMNFSESAEMTIFYLQRRADNSKLSHSVAAQMDIAF